MSFGILVLLVVAGLAGPLTAALHRLAPPAVVGEVVAGVIIGTTGFRWVHTGDPTLAMFASVGFAMLMFVVGTHLPIRDPQLRPALARGVWLAVTTGALALGGGFALAPLVGYHHPLVLCVLGATSSAAVALPVLQGTSAAGPPVMTTVAWVAVADVVTVLAIPLVMSTGQLGKVILGGVLVIALAGAAYLVATRVARRRLVSGLRAQSHQRGWALDLRASLAVLFLLAWIATRFGTSILIAGFAAGSVVALLGEPRRVAQQLIGIAEGFFIPLFFVDLGARLDLRAFVRDTHAMVLAAALLGLALVAHVGAARLWRLPVGSGLAATAQLGVPSAIASIGLSTKSLTTAQASAIMVAVLGSLAACSIGTSMLGRGPTLSDHAAPRLGRWHRADPAATTGPRQGRGRQSPEGESNP